MSDYRAIKSARLSFKGEKKKKKKSKKNTSTEQHDDDATTSTTTTNQRDLTARGWSTVTDRAQLGGPLFLLYNSTPLRCLTVTEEMHQLYFSLISEQSDGDVSLNEAEPNDVLQVFVIRQVTAGGNSYTLRSSTGHYLSADKFGVVTCNKEAAGPTEEWQPVIREDGVAWQSVYGKFLSIEIDEYEKQQQASTTTTTSRGKYSGPRIRADAENITFREVFCVKYQANNVHDRKRTAAHHEIDLDDETYELQQAKRYQSWSGGVTRVANEDKHKLKRAKREGHLAQALLDRREKLKADRYCK
ncbi:FRG1-like family-domain-containing protein [Syncephalis plumigaleata]|nr:FRG1-like family-domain-containing protein [Syncephalis plumigaleata]